MVEEDIRFVVETNERNCHYVLDVDRENRLGPWSDKGDAVAACARLNARAVKAAGGRTDVRDSVDQFGVASHFHRRVINGVTYVFKRVEDSNRNAYIEVCDLAGVTLHLFRGKATGDLPSGVVFSRELGKRLGFF